jgi:hypothetical protein
VSCITSAGLSTVAAVNCLTLAAETKTDSDNAIRHGNRRHAKNWDFGVRIEVLAHGSSDIPFHIVGIQNGLYFGSHQTT